MIAVLSPYELSETSVAFSASMALGERVLTLAPGVRELRDPGEAGEAARGLLARWAWSVPLWESGVLVNQSEEVGTLEVLGAVREAAAQEPSLSAVGRVCGGSCGAAALWRDVSRGGVSPELTASVDSTVNWMGSRADLPVVRAGERPSRERSVWRVGVSSVLGARGDSLLAWRGATEEARGELGSAMEAAIDAASSGGGGSRGASAAVARAAEALESASRGFLAGEADWPGTAVMLVVELTIEPVSASFAGAVRSAQRLLGRRGEGGGVPGVIDDLSVAVLSVRRLPWAPD